MNFQLIASLLTAVVLLFGMRECLGQRKFAGMGSPFTVHFNSPIEVDTVLPSVLQSYLAPDDI